MSKSKQKIKVENEKKSTNITTISAVAKKDTTCLELAQKTNKLLEELSKSKKNTLEHCDSEHKDCGCDEKESKGAKTDLIVLIDTSGSVGSSAKAISDAVAMAIKEASKLCEPDLQITYLGVDGTWPRTVFTQSHRSYITAIHGSVPLTADTPHVGLKSEQGANAIRDLSVYANWREGACPLYKFIR